VLAEIGASGTPYMLVLNKADLLGTARGDVNTITQRILGQTADSESNKPVAVALVSAHTGEGCDRLLSLIDSALPFDIVRSARFAIPLAAAADIALLHRSARVLHEEYQDATCVVDAEAPESICHRLARYVVSDPTRN
jgi:GTPase